MDKKKIKDLEQDLLEQLEKLKSFLNESNSHQSPNFPQWNKELRQTEEKLNSIHHWIKMAAELHHCDEIIQSNDAELSELAKSEKEELNKQLKILEESVYKILVPPDPRNEKDIILELRAGTGGDESSLFAQELARMYVRYAQNKGFLCEAISMSLSGKGGYKEAVYSIEKKGTFGMEGPYGIFKFESGVHRVQRVPETESSGRIHTSTVTVAVLLEVESYEVNINPTDLRIDTYRASGHGGQYLQKTDSAVRITHLPTGLVVQCQDERSQGRNRDKALKLLRAKINHRVQEEQAKKISENRKMQVGTGDRSEKIRTYNFPQDRITDHRVNISVHNMQDVLDGHLDEIIDALKKREKESL